MISNPIILRKGRTVLTIKPVRVVSDENVKTSVEPLSRNCRFNDEIPENMTLFKSYSMVGCRFECMARYSYDQCKCIPWDMPTENSKVKYIFVTRSCIYDDVMFSIN